MQTKLIYLQDLRYINEYKEPLVLCLQFQL